MTDLETTTITIGKNTYEIVCGTCSCSIYRLSDKAAIGRVAETMFYFKNEEEKNAGILDFYNKEKDYLERKEQRRQERLQYNREHKRKTPAQYIKEALQKRFPGVKFSCKHRTFSGGDDVNVSWRGGPLKCEVDPIVRSYEYGTFNGMIDMYEIHDEHLHPREELTKYTWCERELDDEETEQRMKDLGYTAEQLLDNVKDVWQYDKTRAIASIVTCHLDSVKNNRGENWSHDLQEKNEEIGNIIARYVINRVYYGNNIH